MALKESYTKKLLCSMAILFVVFFVLLGRNVYTIDASAATATADPTITTEEVLVVEFPDQVTDASGDTGQFIRNYVTVITASNNAAGHVAYMNTKTNSLALAHETIPTANIPTLATGTTWNRSNTTTNFWGYSLDDSSQIGTYYPMVGPSSPVRIDYSTTPINYSEVTVYFGAKIDGTKESGTYTNTVVFTVISGMSTVPSGGNPDPDPTGPQDTSEDDPVVAYDSSGNQTVYTDTTNRGDKYTEISTGDNRSHYPNATEVTFTPPQGVTTYIGEGTPLATGLAVTSAVAAVSGAIFLIATKRDDDDEEEEEQI